MVLNIFAAGLRIPVKISLDDNINIDDTPSDFESEGICYLRILKQTTWDEFSAAVSQAVLNHFSVIMSDGWESQEALTFNNFAEFNLGLGAITDLSFKLGIGMLVCKIDDLHGCSAIVACLYACVFIYFYL